MEEMVLQGPVLYCIQQGSSHNLNKTFDWGPTVSFWEKLHTAEGFAGVSPTNQPHKNLITKY